MFSLTLAVPPPPWQTLSFWNWKPKGTLSSLNRSFLFLSFFSNHNKRKVIWYSVSPKFLLKVYPQGIVLRGGALGREWWMHASSVLMNGSDVHIKWPHRPPWSISQSLCYLFEASSFPLWVILASLLEADYTLVSLLLTLVCYIGLCVCSWSNTTVSSLVQFHRKS